MLKQINYFFQAFLIYVFFFLGRILGINISRKIFAFLFCYLGPLFKSKQIIHNNIRNFSPNISSEKEEKIIKGMWKNYGMTFIEYVYLNKFKIKNLHMIIKGKDNLTSIIKEKKPVIFVSGHFANFELMSMEITKNDIPLATIYRPLNNIFLNPFMEYLRKKYICKNQIKKGIAGTKDIVKFFKSGSSIALMIDQRVSQGILTKFFEKNAYTTTIPAQFVKKYNCQIAPVCIERNQDDTFNLEFLSPISFNQNKNIEEITRDLNEILEKMILKNPSQWIWTHNRWK